MPQIDRSWVNRILVIDGQSTDGSIEYCRDNGYDVIIQKEHGARNASIDGFAEVDTDIVITFSPDGNAPPEDIPRLIEEMKKGYDMVIASRYLDWAKSEDDNWASSIGNFVFTKTINLLCGGKYTDAMTIYRAYKTRLFYDLDIVGDSGFAFASRVVGLHKRAIGIEPLLSARAARAKLSIGEIPSNEPPRVAGESKIPKVSWGIAYYLQILLDVAFGPKLPLSTGWRPKLRPGPQTTSSIPQREPAAELAI